MWIRDLQSGLGIWSAESLYQVHVQNGLSKRAHEVGVKIGFEQRAYGMFAHSGSATVESGSLVQRVVLESRPTKRV